MKKTVLITGCSIGGLGNALAYEFLKVGYHVIATARDTEKIGPLANKPDVDIFQLDVTLPESISCCLAKIQAMEIKLDILVNNAGCASFNPLVHADVNAAKALYDVNVWGSLRVTQAFIPLLVSSQGVILNIASMAGAVPLAWQGKCLRQFNTL
ncbi:1-acyldihydroxyacetone-phosphate reductase [Fusarium subglutinans]|uniref:1-acyldihydroxyacetone-phosphate reductase n=1 Tax=Gibberella subglutinans TaxID=42677 RepID=A0A8H5KH70_GIBSU|nr:1-acyldihydroxyacetone-phosphate reductase [Fusarium subglutinans]KAF5573777.1 1-acyldihydroxyacetone-phosphate reductase [Fusarium subglutinans]